MSADNTLTRVTLQPAYVLHTRPFRDTSLLCDILTQDHGRISGIARGARGSSKRSRRGKPRWQAFTPLLVNWSTRSDLVNFSGLESPGIPHISEGRALLCGFYLNELLTRLLHRHDPHPSLFSHYQHTLKQLGSPDASLDISLRRFELQCLQEVGYALPLAPFQDVNAATMPVQWFKYDTQQYFVPCHADDPNAISNRQLHALAHQDFSDPHCRQAAKRLLRQAIAQLLEHKPLHSRTLFQATAPA